MTETLTLPASPTVVVKVGTSSIAGDDGALQQDVVERLAGDLAGVRAGGGRVVLVTSGAIAAGLPELGYGGRPADVTLLQAVAAVGQVSLMQTYREAFGTHGVNVGQVLLTHFDFEERSQYLHARTTLRRLLDIGVVPVVNENDTVADDEIRFGDNDRLAALVAHMIAADVLVLLTDQPGLFTADPRFSEEAELIAEVQGVDEELERVAGTPGPLGSGGMASKLAAAKMASWSGVTTVIADARRPGVLAEVVGGGRPGTVVRPRNQRLPARKLWIAFALGATGRVFVDEGAVAAHTRAGGSLLAVGVAAHEGPFRSGDAVEICDRAGGLVAKGLARLDSRELDAVRGEREAPVVVHRDDLVVLA